MGATATLAEFVSKAKALSLDDDLFQVTQHVIMDTIGCALAGHSLKAGKLAVSFAERQPGPFTVLGGAKKVAADAAIFANGQLMNVLDLDECMMNWGHEAPFVLPVALAVGEQLSSSGRDVLRAVAVGYDVAVRVSAALAGPVRAVGKPPNVVLEPLPVFGYSSNIFGSVAAAAVLMELTQEQVENAFGLASFLAPVPNAGGFAAGSGMPMSKYGMMGCVAQSGFTAASLAQMGFTSDRRALDSADGFARLVGSPRFDIQGLTRGLGEQWWISKVSFKMYPSCRMIHVAVDVLTDVIAGNSIAPDEIEMIEVQVWPRIVGSPLFRKVEPEDALGAQFSIPYTMATTVYGCNAFPDFLAPSTMADPKIRALARRVEIKPENRLTMARYDRYRDEPIGPIDCAPCEVRVQTGRGKFVGYAETATGDSFDPDKRVSADHLSRKFRLCAQECLEASKVELAERLLLNLKSEPDLRELMALLSGVERTVWLA